MYYSHWSNKNADWPVAEQDRNRQESQPENEGKKKGGVGRVACIF